MVICSPSVKNVLDRLFLNATTMGRTPVEYNNCIQALHRIESGILRTMAKQPLSWARSHLFVVKTSRYWFGYVIINDIPIVEEVFDSRTNTILTEIINKKLIVTESDIKWMVVECVKRIMTEYKDNDTWGWKYKEQDLRKNGADESTINLLHKAYDVYGEEEALKGKVPNDTGFDIWCRDKEAKWKGKGLRYPHYL